MEYSNGTAEAYRYHHASASYDTSTFVNSNTYCGSNNVPPSVEEFHPNATRRFHPYLSGSDPSVVGPNLTDMTNGGHYKNGFSGQHQCDHCGTCFDSVHGLSEHVQTHHSFSTFPDSYAPPPKSEMNGGGTETAEILDLDSHKVHVYQPPGSVSGLTPTHHQLGGNLAPTPPYTPATSIGSNSSSVGWMTPTPPLPSAALAPPPLVHPQEYRSNPFPAYEMTMTVNGINGAATNGNNSPVTKPNGNGWKSNTTQPTAGGGPPVGSHGGGSEARRPKTYNCEACNKWFTSSGHLKRHYNTTLHKNAIKASGGNLSDGRRSTTPSSQSTGTPTINSPAGSDEKTMEDIPTSRSSLTSPKTLPSSPSNGDYRPPSQLPPLLQQQQLQNGPVNNGYATQQLQHVAPMESYRSPYPGGNHPSGMMTASSSGPPPGGHVPYYCPPPPPHSNYQQPYHQQQMPQQNVYPQSNNMGYPPNSIAPPLSSNGNVQQLGVGPIASSRGIVQQQQHYHLNHEQSFINNNTIVEHNSKVDADFNGMEPDSYLMKSNESDCSGGGSDQSPIGSDDAELDLSDGEESERMVPPTVGTPSSKMNGGTAKSRAAVGVSADSGGTTSVGSFKCTQCDKAFNRVCYLTQHNNTFHKGDKPFKCHMCGKRFPNAELFDQHQQKHAGDKPYKCPLCPKQFNHKTDLRRHMCLHTGQKPFMCQVCSKGFIRKDHMVKHVQTHTRRNAMHAHQASTAS